MRLEDGGTSRPSESGRSGTVVSELRARVAAEEFALVAPFASVFLRDARVIEGVIAASDLAGLTLSALRFLCDRHSAPFSLRTYRPVIADHGWQSSNLVVEVAALDQSSIVNTICEVLELQGAAVEILLSAVVSVERDPNGMARSIQDRDSGRNEVLIHAQVTGIDNPADLEGTLRRRLEVLDRTHREAGDCVAYLRRLGARLRDGDDAAKEAAEFLDWLAAGHMTFAGYETPGTTADPAEATGVYHGALSVPVPVDEPPHPEQAVSAAKARFEDPARPGEFLDEIRILPTTGAVVATPTHRFAGSFTAQASRQPTSGIPIARRVCQYTVAALCAPDEGETAEGVRRVFDGLPIDLVLATRPDTLAEIIRAILQAETNATVRVCVAPHGAASDAAASVTIAAPRGQLTRSETDALTRMVRESVGTVLGRTFVSDDMAVARLHLIVDRSGAARPHHEVEDEVLERVRRLLTERVTEPVESRKLPAPPSPSDLANFPPAPAVAIEPEGSGTDRFRLRVTAAAAPGTINELIATIDNLGLQVVGHDSGALVDQHAEHVFSVTTGGGTAPDPLHLAEVLDATRRGVIEDDRLNGLTWRIGASARSIELLRACCALSSFWGEADRCDLHSALVRYPAVAAAFVRAFAARFDPRLPVASEGQRRREYAGAVEDFAATRAAVAEPQARVALAALARLLERAVRTSFFRGDRNTPGRPIAVKCEIAENVAAPFQTFVYDVHFEGCWWRSAAVARSTLREATSVSDLASTAAAVLADSGMRAGHVSTHPGGAVFARRGSERTGVDGVLADFLRSLLAVADNVVQSEVVRDAAVVAYDGADPYFSLLIDERRRELAEVAQRVVQEASFWMADAVVAVCDQRVAAEGAALRRKTAVSRDVGDNAAPAAIAIGAPHEIFLPPGMRLVAAFDRHEIFLDPAADAAKTAAALARLSRSPRAAWSDVPLDCRGPGSAVLQRGSRKLELSDEVCHWLGREAANADADGIVRAILTAHVDLLWSQSGAVRVIRAGEASDSAGELFLTPADIGAAMVIESGSDVFSPAARIDFALRGGDIRSAASDSLVADVIADKVSNVDLGFQLAGMESDNVESTAAEIAVEVRNAAMAVAQQQNRSIALDHRRAREDWPSFTACIRELRAAAAAIPLGQHLADDTTLEHRQGQSGGMTHPEVIALRNAVLYRLRVAVRTSSLAEDSYVRPWVDAYFPASIAQGAPHLIDTHPLRLEIAALEVATRVVDTMGCAYVADVAAIHARSEIDVVKAWCAAFIFGGGQEVLAEIDDSGIPPLSPLDQRHRLEVARALRSATDRLLDLHGADLGLEKLVLRFGTAAGELLRGWPDLLPDNRREAHAEAVESGIRHGLTRAAADHLTRLGHLATVIDICDLAIQINSPRKAVATAYLGLDPYFRFSEIESLIDSAQIQDPQWGLRAGAHLRARLAAARRDLSADAVSSAAGRRDSVARFASSREREIAMLERLLGEVRTHGGASIAAAEVLVAGLENSSQRPKRNW